MRFTLSLSRDRILAALLVMVLASAGCMRSPEAKSAKFIEEGKKLLAGKDPARAILQFRNAVQTTPKSAEAYYQLGLGYLTAGDLQGGIVSLRKTLELNPKHKDAQLQLSQLMAATTNAGVLQDAQQRLKGLLHDEPDNAKALHALALTELKLGDSGDALEHLGQATAAAPQDVIIAVALAEVKLQAKDPKGAEDVLKKAGQSAPNSVDAVVVLGRFYVSQNRTEEAYQQFQRALTMDGNHAGALVNLSMLQNRTGRKGEAEQTFKRVSGLSDKAFRPFYGVFLFQEGRREESVREFERLAKEDPEDRAMRTRLVAAYVGVNRAADAEKVLAQALKKNSKDLDALLQRGELYVAGGKYAQAEADLNQVVRLQPDSSQVYYVMSKLQLARGSDIRYRENLSKALQRDPYSLPIRLELSQALLASNAKASLDLLDSAPSSVKQSMGFLVQRNWVLLALGDLQGMRKGIDLGLFHEKTPELVLQDGLWKLRTNDFTGARAVLEAALNNNSADVRSLRGLTEAYFAQKQGSLALQKVKEYADREPKSAAMQQFLGTMLWATGDPKGARAAFEAAIAADRRFVIAKLALVQMDASEGKIDDGRERVNEILSKDADNVTARLWSGMLEEVKGNHSLALEQFRKVVDRDPNNAKALNNLASILAEYGNKPDEALKYAQRALELGPDNPEFADTLGWILYRKGLYPAAVQQMEHAASRDGKAVWKFHLAMGYAKAGDFKRGRATLEAGLKQNPNMPEAKMAQAMLGEAK